jgi:hypothetical protein
MMRALEQLQPDLLLIEGPPDAQALMSFAAAAEMRPPVALVVYPRERPAGGVFYPFASFSPEWNALRYGLQHDIPTRFCDLPQAVSLATNEPAHQDEPDDPVALLAEAAGEADPERWWERLVEQRRNDVDVFQALIEAMAAVRAALPAPSLRELRREAHMRQAIRRGRSQGFVNVAVVCGAWHAPVLDVLPPRKNDDALLRGLKKIAVEATWVPWTASRLAYASGYGAGIQSPAWYRHLWETNGDLTAWLTGAARLLREQELDASPAQVVDAVRLTEALAAVRGRPEPTLSEVTDATLAVLCGGEPALLTVIERQLVVGEDMGTLPPGVPAVPLQRDIEATARRLRLRAEVEERTLDLDLRQPNQLEQSRFLLRLRLLSVDWGRPQPPPMGKLGTFHELWTVRWRPELALQMVEAGVYGNTVVLAATARAIARAEHLTDLSQTAALVEAVLLADLEAAMPRLIALLGVRSAESTDVGQMLRALPPLASTLRYGDVRQTDSAALAGVVRALVERVTAGLTPACANLDDEAAQHLAADIVAATQALTVLTDPSLIDDWWAALRGVLDGPATAALIGGGVTRLLLSAERLGDGEAEARLARALARGTQPAPAALWLEGFLTPGASQTGSGMLLATSQRVFGLIDAWLSQLPESYFAQVLPLLRRTTSTFSTAERRLIGERARTGSVSILAHASDELDVDRAALVEPVVLAILGLSST